MTQQVPALALVVEDDQLQREMLSELLSDGNMDVIQCETAEAAELVIAHSGAELRLLVTDVQLAGPGDGLELARFAKQQFPHLTVIVVSGQEQSRLPAGVRFFRKPFRPTELLQAASA
jgi:CheY-like chemotaxis protein